MIGSNFAVDAATNIAISLGVSQRFIGLTIVALGTSLPELVTSVTAAKKAMPTSRLETSSDLISLISYLS